MHTHTVNASIQIVPIVQDIHPYKWVDEAISVIKASGIKYEVGPFSTILEGSYTEILEVVSDVNEFLLKEGCSEWIANVQIQIRSNGNVTSDEKTKNFR